MPGKSWLEGGFFGQNEQTWGRAVLPSDAVLADWVASLWDSRDTGGSCACPRHSYGGWHCSRSCVVTWGSGEEMFYRCEGGTYDLLYDPESLACDEASAREAYRSIERKTAALMEEKYDQDFCGHVKECERDHMCPALRDFLAGSSLRGMPRAP